LTHLLERFAEHGGIEPAPSVRASVRETDREGNTVQKRSRADPQSPLSRGSASSAPFSNAAPCASRSRRRIV
jgi:hypothetical protein